MAHGRWLASSFSAGREHLEACLASVLDQDIPLDQCEVVYVHNGSRDGSPAALQRRRRYHTCVNIASFLPGGLR